MFGIIYAGENLLTHKIYVGQTVRSLKKRIREHKNNTKSLIGRALHKYGEENFVWVILEECDSREQLDEREIYWIKTLNTKFPNGYNLTDGGNSSTKSIFNGKNTVFLKGVDPNSYYHSVKIF